MATRNEIDLPDYRPADTPRREPEIAWHYAPRIEPGEYRAYCRSYRVYRDPQFKRWVCAVQFDILNGSLIEVLGRLTWYLNLGAGERPRAGRRGNYWREWVKANGASPQRGDRLSARVFVRRHATVEVADTARDFRQMTVGADEAYSVVRGVISWDTGA